MLYADIEHSAVIPQETFENVVAVLASIVSAVNAVVHAAETVELVVSQCFPLQSPTSACCHIVYRFTNKVTTTRSSYKSVFLLAIH